MITGRQLRKGIRITLSTRSNVYVWRVMEIDGLDITVCADWDLGRREVWGLQDLRGWIRDGIAAVDLGEEERTKAA